ncbi:hypothetical protein M569_07085 [Genlisea aurea]|uniref:SCP domain-containing protein n=1 Tax=Genlisea aurea TaxID=192259 RepID=S8CLS7_9LAMI|nr:hypothetical protein M569_07085 [Genlisea aurea]
MATFQISGIHVITFIVFLTVATTAAAVVVHPIPKNQLRRRSPVKTQPPAAPPFVPKLNWEQSEYVNAHNAYRKIAGVPALTWSGELTSAAHSWAEARRHDCDYRRHSPNRYGENIFWMSYKEFSPSDVVMLWFNESRLYDRKSFACSCRPERKGCECGHYLNVIWSGTTRVGCSGAVYCDDQKGVYVVCNYDPPGLVANVNPFTGKPIVQ